MEPVGLPANDAPPDPEASTTIHATFADRERLGGLRRVILERGAAALPPALAPRLRAALTSRTGRHKSVGLGVVLSLALDALELALHEVDNDHGGKRVRADGGDGTGANDG